MLCRVVGVKSLPVHHHSASYILFPLGSLSPSWLFWKSKPLKPVLEGVRSLENYSVAHEETQSNRISDFCDSVCVLCFQKQSFCTFSSGFPLHTFLLGFADSFCFVFTSTPSYEASPLCSILCNLFPRLCWYDEIFKGGFEGVLVLLLLTTVGVFLTCSSP